MFLLSFQPLNAGTGVAKRFLTPLLIPIVFAGFIFFFGVSDVRGDENDEKNIREAARITGDPIEVVRNYYRMCESGVTSQMAQCAEYLWKAEDKELNSLYKELRRKVGHGSMAEKKLINAQRAWIVFRDATCTFESAGYSGGTMEGVMTVSCLQIQTKKRNEVLKGYLNCTSNDCP